MITRGGRYRSLVAKWERTSPVTAGLGERPAREIETQVIDQHVIELAHAVRGIPQEGLVAEDGVASPFARQGGCFIPQSPSIASSPISGPRYATWRRRGFFNGLGWASVPRVEGGPGRRESS